MITQKFIHNHLYHRSVLSYLFFPLSFFYGLILIVRRHVYHLFPILKFHNKTKLICIGNITSGGTGKSPFVIFLSQYLIQRNYKIAIITRGYKGQFENENVLISDNTRIYEEAKLAGDEPFFIATRLKKVPVMVGKDRIISIAYLEKHFPDLDYILLDDAYQFLKLNYSLTFLIFNGIKPLGNGFILPAGILREPFINARYADFFVYNSYHTPPTNLINKHKPIISVHYSITRLVDTKSQEYEISFFNNKRLSLVSAIGIPQSFEQTINEHQLHFINHLTYPDHFDYGYQNTISILKEYINENQIDYLFCTEKDYAKFIKLDHQLPLIIVETSFQIDEKGTESLAQLFKKQ